MVAMARAAAARRTCTRTVIEETGGQPGGASHAEPHVADAQVDGTRMHAGAVRVRWGVEPQRGLTRVWCAGPALLHGRGLQCRARVPCRCDPVRVWRAERLWRGFAALLPGGKLCERTGLRGDGHGTSLRCCAELHA